MQEMDRVQTKAVWMSCIHLPLIGLLSFLSQRKMKLLVGVLRIADELHIFLLSV